MIKVLAKVDDVLQLTKDGLMHMVPPELKEAATTHTPNSVDAIASTNTTPQNGTFVGCFQFQFKPDNLYQVNLNHQSSDSSSSN